MVDISHKMRVLSLFAFGGVMLIHSAAPLYSPESAIWNRLFAGTLCESLMRWAVPFFFFGSGFWLGKGRYFLSEMSYGSLLRGKVKSLVLPYFVWAVIGACVGMPLIIGTNLVSHAPWCARTFLDATTLFDKIDNLFGLTHVCPMHCGVLWFVRALIFCFVFAPFWKGLLRVCRNPCVVFVIALIAIIAPGCSVPYIGLSTNVIGQFVSGIAIARLGWIERPMPKGLCWISLFSWCLLSCANGARIAGVFVVWGGEDLERYLILPGVVAMLGAYDHLCVIRGIKLHPLALETFWLYLSHQMMAAWVIAMTFLLLGKGNAVAFILVFATPALVIPSSIFIASVLKKRFPLVFGILTGGRG